MVLIGSMLITAVSRLVELCTRFPWVVITFVLATCDRLGRVFGQPFRHHDRHQQADFAGTCPGGSVRSPSRRRFPGHFQSILVVVDAPTPELAAPRRRRARRAAARRASSCSNRSQDLSGDPFFAHNGLLFQPAAEAGAVHAGAGAGRRPLIDVLASDPSLRGLTRRTQSRARRRAARTNYARRDAAAR